MNVAIIGEFLLGEKQFANQSAPGKRETFLLDLRDRTGLGEFET